jgi:hypothetical protein
LNPFFLACGDRERDWLALLAGAASAGQPAFRGD